MADSSGTTNYTYDNVGNLQSFAYPNGVTTSYAYDTLNRLNQVVAAVQGAPVASYAYTLGAAGNRTSVAELSGRTVGYGYDALYRLTQESVSADPNGKNGTVSYAYDNVGNRQQMNSTLGAVPAGVFFYNPNDQLTTDTYDANGNTTASAGITSTYDFENHMVQKGAVAIVYDGDGNRVAETVGGVITKYLVDTQNPTGYAQVVEELQNGVVTKTYSYGLERISENWQPTTGNWQRAFYGFDGHGSVRFLTSSAGTITDTYDYDAFGNLTNQTDTTPNNYLFAGEQFDPALNLYYNRARYLNTSTGRFWSMDSYEGDPQLPLSVHKYAYVYSDPADHLDRTGHQADLIAALAVATVVVSFSTIAFTPVISSARVTVHFDEIKAFPRAHHAYLLLSAKGRPTLIFRGGPSGGEGCGLSDVAYGKVGSDTSEDCGYLTSAGSDQQFDTNSRDYPHGPGDDVAQVPVTPLRASNYDDLRAAFSGAASKVDTAHLPYDPTVNNSNAFAYTLIRWALLLAPEPPVWAPGWGNALLNIPSP